MTNVDALREAVSRMDDLLTKDDKFAAMVGRGTAQCIRDLVENSRETIAAHDAKAVWLQSLEADPDATPSDGAIT